VLRQTFVCCESSLTGASSAVCGELSGHLAADSQVSAQKTGANPGAPCGLWWIPLLENRETSGIQYSSKRAKGGVPDRAQVSAQKTGANLGHLATCACSLGANLGDG